MRSPQHEHESPDAQGAPDPGVCLSFADLARRWLDDWSRPRLDSHRANVSRIERHLTPLLGDADAAALDGLRLDRLTQELLARGLSRKTVNNCLGLVSSILSKGEAWGLIPENRPRPAKLRTPGRPIRTLTRSEVRRLLAATPQPHRDIFAMLYMTGRRLREVLDLERDHVIRGGAALQVVASKSGRVVVQPLTKTAQEIVRARLPKASPWLFPNPRTGKPYRWIRRAWKKALREAELQYFRIHDLRHTFVSHGLQAGVPMGIVSRWLGHSSIDVTMRVYAHFAEDWQEETIQALDLEPE